MFITILTGVHCEQSFYYNAQQEHWEQSFYYNAQQEGYGPFRISLGSS